MKVEYRDIKNGDLLFTCEMDAIPRIGDRVIVNTCLLSVEDVLWWVDNSSEPRVQITVA